MAVIDILMAVHNPDLVYFNASLQSIKNQTFYDFRLVVVDDGTSNCDVESIVSEYGIEYLYIRNDVNLGLARSLNRGLQKCTGEYIARMDDDDIMLPDRLRKQYDFAQEHTGFIFCNAEKIDKDGFAIIENNRQPVKDIKRYLKKSGNCLTHSAMFVKRKILNDMKGYDERFVYAQDYALYMKAIDKYDFFMMSETQILYRVPYGRATKMKEILSLLSCYAAAVEYFSRVPRLIHYFYFFRRSAGLIRLLFYRMRSMDG